MDCRDNGARPINSFALVTYIPAPLGAFLDDLRRELVPGCLPHAHVTILPPRTLSVTPQDAWKQIYAHLIDLPPFTVGLSRVEMFGTTSVVYVAVERGWSELQRMHTGLDTGPLAFPEPFSYHPHVTLAQELASEQAVEAMETAARRWQEYRGPKSFAVETITFVQNTDRNEWIDLAHLDLGAIPAGRP